MSAREVLAKEFCACAGDFWNGMDADIEARDATREQHTDTAQRAINALSAAGYRIVKLQTAQDKCDFRAALLAEISADVLGDQTKCVSVMRAALHAKEEQ